MDSENLQANLGYRFKQLDLLSDALTHRSVRQKGGNHYERLEFLGDAVLDLVISKWLMEKFPDSSEGVLSRLRSELVNGETLAGLARFLGLEQHVRMGRGESKNSERGRCAILGDVYEAIVGAIFLDSGFETAQAWVLHHYEKYTQEHFDPKRVRDFKSLLQEWTQSRALQLPMYQLLKDEGPDHEKTFSVQCRLVSGETAEGEGPTKKIAEQNAARNLLFQLGVLSHDH